MTITARITASIQVRDRRSGDLGAFSLDPLLSLVTDYAAGTGSGEIDQQWSDARQLAAAAHDDLDLTSLPAATADPRGAGVAFSAVKRIAVLKTDSGDYLEIGGGTDGAGAADALAGTDDYPFSADGDIVQVVGQNGLWLWINPEGCAVAAGTAVLHIGGITSTQDYQILILGNA